MDVISTSPAFIDDRGAITDLLVGEGIDAITLITFSPGAVRANHFHKETTQWNYVISGEVMIVTQFEGLPSENKLLLPGDIVKTVPNEFHALKAITPAQVLIMTKGPRAGFDYESDTYRLAVPLI